MSSRTNIRTEEKNCGGISTNNGSKLNARSLCFKKWHKTKSIPHSDKSSVGNNTSLGNLLRMSTYLTYLSVFIQRIWLGWSNTTNNEQRAWYSLDVTNAAASDDGYLMINIANDLAIFENKCSLFTEVINNIY